MKILCCGGNNGSMDTDSKNPKKGEEAVGERKWSSAITEHCQQWLDNPRKSGLK